jgi:integrase
MTQEPAQRTPAPSPPLFEPSEPVLAGVADSPVFGDDTWDLNALRRNSSEGALTVDLTSVADPADRLLVKEVLMSALNPNHPRLAQLRWQQPSRQLRPIGVLFWQLRSLLAEFAELGVRVPEAHHRHTARLLDNWTHNGLAPSTIRSRVGTLRLLRTLDPLLTGGGLSFEPWPGRSAADEAGDVPLSSNKTAPIPWDLWSSLIAGAWLVVDRYSSDIIRAHRRQQDLASLPRNGPVRDAEERFGLWLELGGLLPLHTGYEHRGLATTRGEINRALLARLAGIHPNCLRPAHPIYRPAIGKLIDAAAKDPERTSFGGISQPAIETPNGKPWVTEIGMGEAEYLASALRAACYVIVAALTGMRDSEIQELKRDSICKRDGLPALRSIQYKGVDNPSGDRRAWWAPAPAMRAANVLAQLSPHPTLLFARSAKGDFSDYAPSRDIPRLLGFLSAKPEERPGRGAELGHERRMLAASFDRPGQGKPIVEINQRSLRQSFSIWAARHPEAELGLGIQLGHASLRQTFGYATDRTEAAVRLLDDKRGAALETRAQDLLNGPLAGPAGEELGALVEVLNAEEHAALVRAVGERLYVGIANDCVRNDARAACGPGIPQLHNHNCANTSCGNCLIGPVHAPVWHQHARQLDNAIGATTQPALRERLIADRARVGRVLADLDQGND